MKWKSLSDRFYIILDKRRSPVYPLYGFIKRDGVFVFLFEEMGDFFVNYKKGSGAPSHDARRGLLTWQGTLSFDQH